MNMIQSAKDQIAALTRSAYRAAVQEGLLPDGVETSPRGRDSPRIPPTATTPPPSAWPPPRPCARTRARSRSILTQHMKLDGTYFTSVEIAGPGFLNFRLGEKWYADVVAGRGARGGRLTAAARASRARRYMVEFVSANPTGPMHMGNARGGVLGDTLAERAGAGPATTCGVSSMSTTPATRSKSSPRASRPATSSSSRARTRVAFPEDGYHGDDIKELAQAFLRPSTATSYLDKTEAERHDALWRASASTATSPR